jgi:glycosyltransferase involved in cell wall biosynthesis
MKLLIISHSCITPINQQFFAEVEQQTGWDLIIVTPSMWKNEYGNTLNPEQWPEFKGQLLSIPVWNSGNIPLHIYRSILIRLFLKLQPDVIYVHHEPYSIAAAQVYIANRLSLKRPIGFFTWQNIFKQYPYPFQQLQKFVFKESSFAISGSVSAEQVLRDKGYLGKSSVVPAGIDPNIYYPVSKSEELKRQLRLAHNEILIGYLGRIVEEKGLKTLLHALQKLQDLPWRLILVGLGTYEKEFDTIAENMNLKHRISRLGYVPHPEAPLYLSSFDILVLPSETRSNWKEQFGRVIIEAMACGTPVVGSNSGEIPHLIRRTCGGLIFQEGDPEDFAEQLNQLILDSSLRRRLAEGGRASVLQNYTNSSLAQHFAQVIEGAVRGPHRQESSFQLSVLEQHKEPNRLDLFGNLRGFSRLD